MNSANFFDHAVLQQAASWYALLRDEQAHAQDRRAWLAWLEQSSQHREAWAFVERVGQRFAPLQQESERERAFRLLDGAKNRPMGRRQVLLSLGVLAATGALGVAGIRRNSWLADGLMRMTADYSTAIGEIRELSLSDGSHTWLNTASAINVGFYSDSTRLQLRCGEVLLQTLAGRAGYTYQVATEDGVISNSGGTFSVRREDDSTRLCVLSGSAELLTAAGSQRKRVTSGQQVVFTANQVGAIEELSPGKQAWTKGLLVANGTPLGQVIAELSRYHQGYLGCDPGIAGLSVVGSFPLNAPVRALQLLEAALPVRVRHTLPWWVTVEGIS